MFPKFKIIQIMKNENKLELIGTISSDSFKDHKWVDDKWVGSLKLNDSIIFGRWYKETNDWKFIVDKEDIAKANFAIEQEVELVDGYWGERVELVIDKSIKWREAIYLATGKRDHDHCLICWARISEIENKHYLIANEQDAVCSDCFENYIKQVSFDFIVYPDN